MTPIQQELAYLCDEHGGTIPPEAVIEYAKDPETALHAEFEWDDTKAAHEHRLSQARRIINVQWVRESPEEIRRPVYVSLVRDRKEGVGYRRVSDVMTDEELRAELFRQLMKEIEAWQNRAARFHELAPVFKALDVVKRRLNKPKRARRPASETVAQA